MIKIFLDTYLGWENCFDGSSSPFPFGLSLIMMIIDIIWMILLASYLSQVYPPGEIPAKSFFFFLVFYLLIEGKESFVNFHFTFIFFLQIYKFPAIL